jgi:hypothetical protein
VKVAFDRSSVAPSPPCGDAAVDVVNTVPLAAKVVAAEISDRLIS